MLIDRLCSPALIYLAFSIIQLILDMSHGKFKLAIAKLFITLIFTYLLNLLCDQKLTKLSWVIVFLPFIFMGYISLLLVYALGFSDKNGNDIPVETSDKENNEDTEESEEEISTLDVSAFEPFYGHSSIEAMSTNTTEDDSEPTEDVNDAIVTSVSPEAVSGTSINTAELEQQRRTEEIGKTENKLPVNIPKNEPLIPPQLVQPNALNMLLNKNIKLNLELT